MPSHYLYRCTDCGDVAMRYRNSRRCRKCHGIITRVSETPWTLVTPETMPSTCRDVLCRWPGDKGACRWGMDGHWWSGRPEEYCNPPTHWMPLPDDPLDVGLAT